MTVPTDGGLQFFVFYVSLSLSLSLPAFSFSFSSRFLAFPFFLSLSFSHLSRSPHTLHPPLPHSRTPPRHTQTHTIASSQTHTVVDETTHRAKNSLIDTMGFFWWHAHHLWIMLKDAPRRPELDSWIRSGIHGGGLGASCIAVHVRHGDSVTVRARSVTATDALFLLSFSLSLTHSSSLCSLCLCPLLSLSPSCLPLFHDHAGCLARTGLTPVVGILSRIAHNRLVIFERSHYAVVAADI